MAAFCGNCGNTLGENDRVCGKCGTPVVGKTPAPRPAGAPQGSGNKMNMNKIIALSAIGVVALVIIIAAVVLVSKSAGYKGKINKALACMKNEDVDGMMKLTSHLLIDAADEYDVDLEDEYEELIDDMLDDISDDVGDIKSLSFEVRDAKELSERKLEDLKETLEDDYDVDSDDIKAVVEVSGKIKAKGKNKEKSYGDQHFICIKENGGWKLIYSGGYSDVVSAFRYVY